MNHENADSLPSLACPVIRIPVKGVRKDESPLRKPPYPAIDQRWAGFTIPHLHWVGITFTLLTKEGLSEEEFRRVDIALRIALLHEACHKLLASTPFSRFKQYEMFRLYLMLVEVFEEKKGLVRVPLIRNKSGNELQKQWELIARLGKVSRLIEEVFAVRTSLIEAREHGIIKRDRHLVRIIDHYKKEYGGNIDGFEKTYDAFDFVARKIGKVAALAIINEAFETLNPNLAFLEILANGFQWHVSDKSTDFIANLSFEEACHFFSGFIKWVDPDDSRYLKKGMIDIGANIKEDWSVLAKEVKYDFTKFSPASDDAFLFSAYRDGKYYFSEVTGYGEFVRRGDYRGDIILVLEAILQQLIKGIGLLCPFWNSSLGCCSKENKELLEKVWSCTSHDRSCNWKRMGCLAKGGPHCTPISMGRNSATLRNQIYQFLLRESQDFAD
jgi:hypothetical protein